MIEHLTDEELIRHVDNKPDATPLERELADRLQAAIDTLRRALKTGDDWK